MVFEVTRVAGPKVSYSGFFLGHDSRHVNEAYILRPLLLSPLTNPIDCTPSQVVVLCIDVPSFFDSSSRRDKNASVSVKFGDLSVVMNNSLLA